MVHSSIRRSRWSRAGAALLAAWCAGLISSTRVKGQQPDAPAPPPQAPEAAAPPSPAEQAVTPPAATAPSDATLTAAEQAELDALVPTESDIELRNALEMPSITAYGFADFSVHSQNADSLPKAVFGESPTFFVGNLNLYLRADLTRGWKSLAEVRFTYLPNGNLQPDYTRQSTQAGDYVEFYSPMRWGGIVVERAWLEYTVHPLLTVRAGQWLTPIGIWNVDHGTPTIIPAIRPFIIGAGMFPESQTGFELYGSQLIGETTVGYHLTLSNGRGNLDQYADFDKNKGVGGRVYASFPQLGTLTLGASAYGGRATDANAHFDPTAGPPPFVQDILIQYDEFVYAFDLLWKYSGFHLQSEFISQSIAYTDAGRPSATVGVFPGAVMPDDVVLGFYVLLAYELPWLPLMPFLQVDYTEFGSTPYLSAVLDVRGPVFGPGLNYRPVETVTLKAQYYQGRHKAFESDERLDLRIFRLTAAWSF